MFCDWHKDGLDSSRRETLKTGLRIEIDPLLVEAIDFDEARDRRSIQLYRMMRKPSAPPWARRLHVCIELL